MRVDFFSTQPYDQNYFNQLNQTHQIVYHAEHLNEKTASLAKGAQAVCVFVNDTLDKACIDKLAKFGIRYIALRCAGFNNVDLTECHKNQIKIVRVPAYSPNAVAEHAMAILLTLVRKTHKAYNRVREGNFSLKGLEGITLANKTVGIIGLGKIGTIFAQICLGFGCQVQAFDPEDVNLSGVKSVSCEEVIQTSDIISLHCPLTNQTYHLIDAAQIEKMKPGAIIINTGRGALINAEALIDALKKKTIAAVGLDVYEQESSLFFSDHSEEVISDDVLMRLMTFPNVLITGHQGFFTHESLMEIARVTLNNLDQLEKTHACDNEIQ
ncbi:2-hydroxyacid dehydrogenase [Legionella sp. W05-934-2]|uniref:2-hydroxyacid dehydrogenase n=1 Tax=Legionella sp. W05-934-2 TaxID=1198649 RepID=UPI003461BA3C